MQSIIEDIRTGELRQVYLLYGEEAYLKKQYRDKLRTAFAGEGAGQDGGSMNSHYYEGRDVRPGEIIDLAETLPFFAESRVIVIENSGLFKKGGEELAKYLEQPAPSVRFIFVENEVDKRSRLYKAALKIGRAVEFGEQDAKTLKKWVLGILGRENKKITEAALDLFFEKTGTDMENIRMELEKLLCYTLNKEAVEASDVESVCTHRISSQIFDMVNAIADKKQKQALSLYYDLLALREPPMRILFLIARQFNLLLQVKELKSKGCDHKTIGTKTGLHGFLVGKYAAQASKFSEADLRRAVEACVEAETDVKTGRMGDTLSIELLIVRYSA